MAWVIRFHEAVVAEAHAQPADIRARLEHLTALIAAYGPERQPPKAAKHVTGELWELRLLGKDGIARVFTVTRRGRILVILRVFSKKTQKTPPREIRLALQRAEEV